MKMTLQMRNVVTISDVHSYQIKRQFIIVKHGNPLRENAYKSDNVDSFAFEPDDFS